MKKYRDFLKIIPTTFYHFLYWLYKGLLHIFVKMVNIYGSYIIFS